jgi:hypothetical protein
MRRFDAPDRKSKPTDVFETILDQFAGFARCPGRGRGHHEAFKKALVERMLGGEVTHDLGYPPGCEKSPDTRKSA